MKSDCFKKTVSKFFTVKTVITLVIVFTFCFKSLQGADLSDAFVMIVAAVITYYFCKDNDINERVREHEKDFHRDGEHE